MKNALWPILCFFVISTTIGQFIVPLDYGPDEPMHMEYIHILGYEGRLPTRQETHIVQHPPVFYALMAIPWRLMNAGQRPLSVEPGPQAMRSTPVQAQAARRVLRVIQTLLACLSLWLISQILTALHVPPRIGVLWLSIIAVWPMFGYISSVVNNENASIAWSAFLCWMIVRRVLNGNTKTCDAIVLGALCGVGMLIKQTTLFALPIALWAIGSTSVNKKSPLLHTALFCGAAVAFGVWWPLYNFFTSGHAFPSFTTPADQFALPFSEKLIETPGTLRLIFETSFLPDWASRILPRVIAFFAVLSTGFLLCALYFASVKARGNSQTLTTGEGDEITKMRRLQLMSCLAFFFLLLGILQYIWLKDYMAQIGGRYLLNGLPWILTLCGSSLVLFARQDGEASATEKTLEKIVNTSTVLLVALTLISLFWWFMASAYFDGLINGIGA